MSCCCCEADSAGSLVATVAAPLPEVATETLLNCACALALDPLAPGVR